jgi:ABC-type lipoprotein release transport system permease subunit
MMILRFLFRRVMRHWQLFLTLILGVVVATALLASGPLLVDTATEFGLRHRLLSAEPLAGNLRLRSHNPTVQQTSSQRDAEVRAIVQQYLGDRVSQVVLSVASYWLIPWVDEEPRLNERVNVRYYQGIAENTELVAGSWPSEARAGQGVYRVVIGEEMAQNYSLQAGDRLPLSFDKSQTQPDKWLEVSGIVRPRDPGSPYWFGESSPLHAQSDKRWSAQYSTFVPLDVYFEVAPELLPNSESEVVWNVLVDPEKIAVGDISLLRGEIAAQRTELYDLQPRVMQEGQLDDLLNRFAVQSQEVRVPLYILTAEIVLLALYYVAMTAALAAQQAEREFAILRSRGATEWQIVSLQAGEAGLIAAVAFLSGPGLAALLVQGITSFGPLADLRISDWVLGLTPEAWLAAAVGALACLLGLLLPLGPTLRRSIVTHQQALARPARAPWWQRLYLDVVALAIGLILLWRLQLYGGVTAGTAGQPRVDWLLLLSPLILLLGAATILLRVLPLVLQLFARLAARGRGLPGVLALGQVARNPARVVLLVLLLTLAMALGVLSSGLNRTLDVSERERAQYAAGSDVRLVASRSGTLLDPTAIPEVRAATRVGRGTGTVNVRNYRAMPRFEFLAVDPQAVAAMSTFRDDFAAQPLDELLAQLAPQKEAQSAVLALPGRPAALGIWVWGHPDSALPDDRFRNGLLGDHDLERIQLSAKVQTAAGEMLTFDLESAPYACSNACCSGPTTWGLTGMEPPTPFDCPYACCWRCCPEGHTPQGEADPQCEWSYFQGQLPELAPSSYPLALHSLWIRNVARDPRGYQLNRLTIAMDDLTVVDQTGVAIVADSFEDPTTIWTLLAGGISRYDKSEPHSGQTRQRLELSFEQPQQIVGFKVTKGIRQEVLPVLASPAFLQATSLQVGDGAVVWISSLPATDIRIAGEVQYFPTMYENQPVAGQNADGGFLILPRDPLLDRLNELTPQPVNASELWLSTAGPIPPQQLDPIAAAANQSYEVEAVRSAIKADPMSLGLRSVTSFGYILTSVLSIVGFATYFYMSARQRESIYGVLRTMGLAPRQLYGSLILEQVILILSGLAMGTLLGTVLNRIILPGLPITLGDRPPIPPFRPLEDWAAVGRIYLILGGAFLVTLGVATLLLWRARIHRVLRIGEE